MCIPGVSRADVFSSTYKFIRAVLCLPILLYYPYSSTKARVERRPLQSSTAAVSWIVWAWRKKSTEGHSEDSRGLSVPSSPGQTQRHIRALSPDHEFPLSDWCPKLCVSLHQTLFLLEVLSLWLFPMDSRCEIQSHSKQTHSFPPFKLILVSKSPGSFNQSL